MADDLAARRGYLVEAFRVFRLQDSALAPIPPHYHDFHKIILFLSGEAGYVIEGREWQLAPRDIILVRAGDIHQPLPAPGVPYERLIIYVSPAFLESCRRGDDLARCFALAAGDRGVQHLAPGSAHDLLFHMEKLERTAREGGFAHDLYTEMLFIEFMILLNRALLGHELDPLPPRVRSEKIQRLLAYINDHLTDDLSVERLAAALYVSRFHLMRQFKAATGYSLHQYILSKRLLRARRLLLDQPGMTAEEAAAAAGFADVSGFFRAFRRQFHTTPGALRAAAAPGISSGEKSPH
ncbi:MAG: helix-turn-helix domain-containing protein [Schwartzia sp.]|nr:helix-turn-helix domain-containing protein [Schwartzia sp. (in: firmicutes)]